LSTVVKEEHTLVCTVKKISGNSLETPPEVAEKSFPGKIKTAAGKENILILIHVQYSDPPGQGPLQPTVGDPVSAGGLD